MCTLKQLLQTSAAIALFTLGAPAHSLVSYYTDFTSFDAATTATLVEDFEAIAPKDTPLGSITSNGITYAPVSPATNVWVASPGYTNFGIPGATASSVLTATGPERFTITPAAALAAIGFNTYTNQDVPAVVNVFGALGLLSTFDLTALASSTVGFLGIKSTDPITKVEWYTTGGERINTGIDNVYVQRHSVPSPSALLLIAAGLIALGRSRRA